VSTQKGTSPSQVASQAIRESVPHILERLGIAVAELVNNSRKTMPGTVFAAYPGETRDGRDFIAQAVAQRVDGVLWEADHYQWDPALAIPNAGVLGLKTRIGEIAAHVYGEPSRALHMVGITGTNGKTSVAHWVAQAFTQLGRKTAVIGTVGNGFPGTLTPALNTTPTPSSCSSVSRISGSRARLRVRWRCPRMASHRGASTVRPSTLRC